jgi:hypothetical protein
MRLPGIAIRKGKLLHPAPFPVHQPGARGESGRGEGGWNQNDQEAQAASTG